jgi:hypothetical protein
LEYPCTSDLDVPEMNKDALRLDPMFEDLGNGITYDTEALADEHDYQSDSDLEDVQEGSPGNGKRTLLKEKPTHQAILQLLKVTKAIAKRSWMNPLAVSRPGATQELVVLCL